MEAPVEHVSAVTDVVSGLMLLMLAASLTALLSNRLPKLPFTIALVLIGALIGELSHRVGALHLLASFELTPELVLFVFLPTLIFESAHNLEARELQSNLMPVLTLAVPGLIISTAIIGSILYAISSFDFIICLLLGSILSATDPVAVIALFKQLGVPERLTVLVEGESLFNDATSLVLATLLLGIAVSGEFSSSTVVGGIGEFLLVFFGGIFVGWLLAMVVCQLLGRIHANPAVEISLTTILAYLSFVIAEHNFHVSGIMAVVAAGLTLGSYGRSKVTPSTVEYLEHFWDYAAWLANALIFLLVGMQVNFLELWNSLGLIAVVAVAMLLSRAIVVFGLVPQLARLPDAEPVSRAYQMVMYWGGLRGAIALAIVLSLPEFDYKATLIAVVMGAVLFTLLVQGLSIEALVKRLGLDKPDFADMVAQREGALHAKEGSLASLDRLEQGGFFSARVASRLRDNSEQAITSLREEIGELTAGMTEEDSLRILAMRALAREKTRFEELFRRGLVGESALRTLSHNVEQQLDDAKHYGKLPGGGHAVSLTERLLKSLIRLVAGLPLLGERLEWYQHSLMMRDYEVSWARFRAASSVLKSLGEIASDNGISGTSVEQVRVAYTGLLAEMQAELEEVNELYPEFVEAAQEKLGRRLLIISEQDAIDRAGELGILPEGVTALIHKEHQQQLRDLRAKDLSAFLEVSVEELLTKVPMFADLETADFATIVPFLHVRSFPKGEKIIRQNQSGDSLFMIARGIAAVIDESGEQPVELNRLFAGDFFGEAALLHGTPRNATVTARSPCTLYELDRDEWHKICGQHPAIQAAVERVDRARA